MDNHGTVIKVNEEIEITEEPFTEALLKKPNNFEKTFNSCLTTHKGHQNTADGVANKDNRAKIKVETNDDNHETVNKKYEENENVKEKITESLIKKTKFNYIKKLKRVTAQNNHKEKIIEGNIFKDSEAIVETDDYNQQTVNEIHEENQNDEAPNVHKETIEGNKSNGNDTTNEANKHFEGMKTDFDNPISPKNYNDDKKQRRSFQCSLCQKWCNTKKQIALHIKSSHKSSTVNHSHRQSGILHLNKCTEGFTKTISPSYTCNMCFKDFSSESNLTKHKRVVKSLLNENVKKKLAEAFVKKPKPNHFEKSFHSCLTAHNDGQKTTDGVANNLNEAVDQPIMEILIEQTVDYYFKSKFQTLKKNAHSNKQQKSIDGNTFNGNDTTNEANKHFEGMETDFDNPISPKNYSDDKKQRRSFQCSLCQKWCNTKKKIALHIKNSHKSSTVKHSHRQSGILHLNMCTEGFTKTISPSYTCNMCFKDFSSESNLTKHKRVVKSLLNMMSGKGLFL